MISQDYYQVLGVSRYASRDAIKRAFRRRVLSLHPDRNACDADASDRTRAVIEAYYALAPSASGRPRESTLTRARSFGLDSSAGARPVRTAPRGLVLLAAAVVTVVMIALLWSAIFGDRTRVYRPRYVPQPVSVAALPIPFHIAEPSLVDAESWRRMGERIVRAGAPWIVSSPAERRATSVLRAASSSSLDPWARALL